MPTPFLPVRPSPPAPIRLPAPDFLGVKTGAPICLYDQVVVPPNGEQPFKSKAFTNNRNRRIQLHEMRVVGTLLASGSFSAMELLTLSLSIKRKSGKMVAITRGYVPVSAICKSTNRIAEQFASFGSTRIGAMSWKFSYPIDLAPGDYIEAQCKNIGIANVTVTVDLSFAGADAADIPSHRAPYVTHWQSRDFAYAETAVDSAPPDQLVNDLGIDFHVDRIIGRFVTSSNVPGFASLPQVVDYRDSSSQSALTAALRLGTAQNMPILRSYTPFLTVFGEDAAIETAFLLAPGDYVTVDVQHTAGATLTTPFVYFAGRGIVSLVGWREVM